MGGHHTSEIQNARGGAWGQALVILFSTSSKGPISHIAAAKKKDKTDQWPILVVACKSRATLSQ